MSFEFPTAAPDLATLSQSAPRTSLLVSLPATLATASLVGAVLLQADFSSPHRRSSGSRDSAEETRRHVSVSLVEVPPPPRPALPIRAGLGQGGPGGRGGEADSTVVSRPGEAPLEALSTLGPERSEGSVSGWTAGPGKGGSGAGGSIPGAGFGSGDGSPAGIPELTRSAVVAWRDPEYPESARDRELEGSVGMLLSLDREGRVQRVTFLTGCPCFHASIRKVTAHWRFRPVTRDGQPVAATVRFSVSFQLT